MKGSDTPVTYPVMEHFHTIQGEGYYTGQSAYFIRLGGCDVGCPWCDVKESWDAAAHPMTGIDELVNRVLESGAPICVITGGEPAMYDLAPLTNALKKNHIRVHLETSGAYPISGNFDWICLSPKKFKAPLKESLAKADEFKAVVFHGSDPEWAVSFRVDLKPGCRLYLQPEWSRADKMIPLIVDFVKKHPEWAISLQTHKYIQVP